MRPPSHQRTRASRRAVLRAALAGVVGLLALVPAGASARQSGDVFVSKGVGRQVFAGGSGVAYGTLFSGGSLIVADYSAGHDLKVDTPVLPTTNADGSRTYVPAGGTQRTAYRISGSVYRLTITGATTFNASGVFGRLVLRGKGTLTVNGRKNRWNGPPLKLGEVPRPIRPLFRLAAEGAPPPVAAPAPPPTTTVTTAGSVPSSS